MPAFDRNLIWFTRAFTISTCIALAIMWLRFWRMHRAIRKERKEMRAHVEKIRDLRTAIELEWENVRERLGNL